MPLTVYITEFFTTVFDEVLLITTPFPCKERNNAPDKFHFYSPNDRHHHNLYATLAETRTGNHPAFHNIFLHVQHNATLAHHKIHTD